MVEAVEIKPNLESIEIKTLSFKEREAFLTDRFNKAVLYDMCMSEYLFDLNHTEMEYRPEFVEAVKRTNTLVRYATYSAFMDILDFGPTEMLKQACDVLNICRKYQERKIEEVTVGGSADEALARIDHYIKDILAVEYGQRYLGINP